MDVSFDEEPTYTQPEPKGSTGLPGMILRLGFIREEKEATPFFLGIVVLAIIVAVFFIFRSGPIKNAVTPKDIQEAGIDQFRYYVK